jgi:hypothetical protein
MYNTRENIRSLITNRVGVDVFLSRIDRLRESREFNTVIPTFIDLTAGKKSGSARSPVVPPSSSADIYFDYAFVTFFKASYGELIFL